MVLEFLYGALNVLFSPVLAMPPIFGELFLAAMISLVTTLFSKYLIDQKLAVEIREKISDCQKKLKELQKGNNKKESEDMMAEMLKLNNKQMSLQMRVMIPNVLLILAILPWMGTVFQIGTIARLPVTLPFFGNDFGWFLWYIFGAITTTQIFRKVLGVYL